MLGAASLVRGDQVPVAVDLLHRRLEPEIAPRACVRLIAEFHGGALFLGHGGGAAIREQIDEHVVGTEQEGVPPGFLHRLAPPLGIA